MVIMHNLMASYSNRQLGINDRKLKINTEKLSSGYKINRAADDAAGLAISEKMRRQIRGLNQGTENMQDGVSWVQIGDGAMEEVQDILHRMTELAVKGANGTLSASDREAIDSEIQQLKTELNRINETTKFNDMRIFSTDHEPPEDPGEFTLKGLTGEFDGLDIFNSSYDADTGEVTYGGIIFYGNRISWDKISPDMVYADDDVQKFHEGTWNYTDAQGRKLSISTNEGDTVPTIERVFDITADGQGIHIDDGLITWNHIKNEAGKTIEETGDANGVWAADYHGMTIKFEIANVNNGLSGMVNAINNGHDDVYSYKACAKYAGSKPVQAVDMNSNIQNVRISKDVAEKIVAGEKYFIGADETGVWLEAYSPVTDTKNKIDGSEKTWAEMGIGSWDAGDDIKADYDYFYSDDDGVNDTHISFSYTLANITSKDSVIDGLNGVDISHRNVRNSYQTSLELDLTDSNVISAVLRGNSVISLKDELDLGRDFEIEDHKVGTNSLQYDTASSEISLSYADASGNSIITYKGQDTAIKQEMINGLNAQEELVIRKKIMTEILGYNMDPKDLKDYLGADKITTSGKMSDTVTLDSTMIRSDGFSLKLRDGETYGCGMVDFSEIDTPREIWELVGSGFDSTCNTCSKHYSFKFVFDVQGGDQVDGLRYRIDNSDWSNPVMEVSVSSLIEKGIANSADPGQEIAAALTKIGAAGFDYHYQQYAAKDGVFYILDERPEYKGTRVSAKFYTTPYNTNMDYRNEYTLNLTSSTNGTQSIKYLYDHSDYEDRIHVEAERDDTNGMYVFNAATGLYEDAALHPSATEKYNIKVSYADAEGNVDDSVTGTKTFTLDGRTITVKTEGNMNPESYATEAIQDMANATRIELSAKDYTKADITGEENPNIAIDSFYSVHYLKMPYDQESMKKFSETIRIQKSGDVPNYLTIPKFALNTTALGLRNASCLTSDSSRNTIDLVSGALKRVSSKRSIFGALQNRMEHAINSNENVSENTTAAESRIRDTDMAKEMLSYSNNQVISQFAQSMLVQANQSSQGVLSLLQ